MLSDHLGSTSALVARNGALNSTNYYHPYGDARSPLSPLTTKRFTGQYHEESLGLYFYNARWYDPLLGRFAQADTAPARSPPQVKEKSWAPRFQGFSGMQSICRPWFR